MMVSCWLSGRVKLQKITWKMGMDSRRRYRKVFTRRVRKEGLVTSCVAYRANITMNDRRMLSRVDCTAMKDWLVLRIFSILTCSKTKMKPAITVSEILNERVPPELR